MGKEQKGVKGLLKVPADTAQSGAVRGPGGLVFSRPVWRGCRELFVSGTLRCLFDANRLTKDLRPSGVHGLNPDVGV